MSLAVETLAKHRQEHQSETGDSRCSCGEWRGPFTVISDERSFAAHLVTELKAAGLTLLAPASGEDPDW